MGIGAPQRLMLLVITLEGKEIGGFVAKTVPGSIILLQTHLSLLKTRRLKIQPKIRHPPANVTVPISKTLEDAAEIMGRVTRGKEIVIETVNVLQVFNAVTITAGEIFHRLEQNGEEDMTVVSHQRIHQSL